MNAFVPGTAQGGILLADWQVFIIVAAIVGAIVVALIVVPPIVWRRRDDALPPQFKKNTPLEIAYTVVPLLIVAALFWVTLKNDWPVEAQVSKPYAVVHVTAFRWSWRFDYPADGVSVSGTPQSPPELALALGEPTRIELVSADVNHAFWVPAFLFKRDAIPGFTNSFDLTPVRAGVYRGECGEFCGIDHAGMTFQVRVLPPAAYRAWIAQHKKAGG